MAAYFIDLDGTFFKFGSMIPAENSVSRVKSLLAAGHQVFFITKRKNENNDPRINLSDTWTYLESLFGSDSFFLFGDVDSPRIIINDDGVRSIRHKRNEPLAFRTDEEKIQSSYDALCTIRYICGNDKIWDADEYIQTMLLAYSLINAGKLDYRMIVEYYRKCPIKTADGQVIFNCGNGKTYPGQISKLAANPDPLYIATDGVTSGCGMKVSPLAMFYKSVEELLANTIFYTRITHNTPDAILCACLVALRYFQVIHHKSNDLNWLVKNIESVPWLYGIKDFDFFLRMVLRAADIVETADGSKLLQELHKWVGLGNLCWCAPLCACMWSFKINSVEQWIDTEIQTGPREINANGIHIRADSIDKEVSDSYWKRAALFGQTNLYHWADSIDRDTFFNISLSIVAGLHGIPDRVYSGKTLFVDDLKDICTKLIGA
jgi:hypothetical protein